MDTQTIKKPTSPKDFFLNLGATILLYSVVINILNLLFSIIDKAIPDPAYYSYYSNSDSIRWAIASLIIIYPFFIYITRVLNKSTEIEPEKINLGIRKWLSYLTIFIVGIAITVDIVILLNTFLGGELTLRFFLKIISLFLVLLITLKYYLLSLKDERSLNKIIFGISTSLVIISILLGFYTMGSPATQRMMRFDETRIMHLQETQSQIINYWQTKGKIPERLDELKDDISGFIPPVDPDTKNNYEYEIISEDTFKLCAEFNLENQKDDENIMYKEVYYPRSVNQENWKHTSGKNCFERKIDKELYPIKIPRE